MEIIYLLRENKEEFTFYVTSGNMIDVWVPRKEILYIYMYNLPLFLLLTLFHNFDLPLCLRHLRKGLPSFICVGESLLRLFLYFSFLISHFYCMKRKISSSKKSGLSKLLSSLVGIVSPCSCIENPSLISAR